MPQKSHLPECFRFFPWFCIGAARTSISFFSHQTSQWRQKSGKEWKRGDRPQKFKHQKTKHQNHKSCLFLVLLFAVRVPCKSTRIPAWSPGITEVTESDNLFRQFQLFSVKGFLLWQFQIRCFCHLLHEDSISASSAPIDVSKLCISYQVWLDKRFQTCINRSTNCQKKLLKLVEFTIRFHGIRFETSQWILSESSHLRAIHQALGGGLLPWRCFRNVESNVLPWWKIHSFHSFCPSSSFVFLLIFWFLFLWRTNLQHCIPHMF